MDLNGHTFIDILKIDIDGRLTTFLSAHAAAEGDVLPVGQLQLEIHAREGHENFEYFARWCGAAGGGGPQAVLDGAEPGVHQPVRGVRPELAEVCRFEVRGLSVG
ncbi:hypothetical protein EDB83DRAFT_2386220 [Lactarius deliciosus]|nr:hypothetical protein EDB83DRAFT_2386220 [Lactarius deliciosus]